jgi:hypothetical protein
VVAKPRADHGNNHTRSSWRQDVALHRSSRELQIALPDVITDYTVASCRIAEALCVKKEVSQPPWLRLEENGVLLLVRVEVRNLPIPLIVRSNSKCRGICASTPQPYYKAASWLPGTSVV